MKPDSQQKYMNTFCSSSGVGWGEKNRDKVNYWYVACNDMQYIMHMQQTCAL